MIRAVLFDMDGLIVDTEPIHFKAFRALMRDYGHELPETIMAKLVGFIEEENIRDLKEMYDLDDPVEEMVARRHGYFMGLITAEPIPVLPGFWEFSEEIKRRGLKQAVVSSSAADQIGVILRRLFEARPENGSPERYFDAIVTGDDIARNKPAPDIYLLGAERVGVPPAECLAIEDTPPGVQSAVSAGCIAIAVPNDYSRDLEFPGARAVITSLHEAARHLDL
jgi:beta-phosphoglucomutase-like phosphatase (HAD superfamily)